MARDILPYPPEGAKGIVYARRSAPGERDQDESISAQIGRGQEWLREHGYKALPAIEDFADSDSWNFYRDKLQELLRRARNHEFQIVVVAAKDRLSRKTEHRPVIRFFLHEAGVKLHSLRPQEEERDEPFAGLVEAFQDEHDEQERIRIRERLNSGKLHRVKQQKLMACSFPLYGYQWADPDVSRGKSRYVENPETAPAVRLAFRLATEGRTLGEICTALTASGYPPPMYYRFLCGKLPRNRIAKKEWRQPSVYTMLTEPKYYGCYTAYATRTEKVKLWNEATRTWVTRKRHIKREENDPLRHVFTEDTCPALVSEDMWLAAQVPIRQNARTAPKRLLDPEAVLLYGGFLVCGYCNKPFFTEYDYQRQYYRYDVRSTAHRDENGNKCPGFNMTAGSPDLDRAVWDEVIRTFEQPEILRKQYAIWQAELEQNKTSEHRHFAAFRSLQTQALEEQASCLMLARKLKKDDHAADLLAAEISRITALIESYATEIARLEATIAEKEATMHELDSMLHAGKQALERLRVMPHKEKRRFMSACGLQVALFPASTRPRFKLLWRLAYMQVATLEALGKKTDEEPPETDPTEGASSFALGTRTDPRPARNCLREKSLCVGQQSPPQYGQERRSLGQVLPVPPGK